VCKANGFKLAFTMLRLHDWPLLTFRFGQLIRSRMENFSSTYHWLVSEHFPDVACNAPFSLDNNLTHGHLNCFFSQCYGSFEACCSRKFIKIFGSPTCAPPKL